MPKLKLGTVIPTEQEDAEISAGIAADGDARELDATWFKEAQPASDVLPRIIGTETADVMLRRRGRKPGINNKVATNIRFDNDLLDAFKATGDGWQTRMNDALRDWAQQHRMLPR
jgi:uncharacterized protein (DUF4415 family)